MIHRIMVHADDMTALSEFIETKPDGTIKVVIFGCKDSAATLKAFIPTLNRDVAQWMVLKIQAGELQVVATPDDGDPELMGKVVSAGD